MVKHLTPFYTVVILLNITKMLQEEICAAIAPSSTMAAKHGSSTFKLLWMLQWNCFFADSRYNFMLHLRPWFWRGQKCWVLWANFLIFTGTWALRVDAPWLASSHSSTDASLLQQQKNVSYSRNCVVEGMCITRDCWYLSKCWVGRFWAGCGWEAVINSGSWYTNISYKYMI